MKLVQVGGRVKAAAVGLDHLYSTADVVQLDNELRALRKSPSQELLAAFFPRERAEIRHILGGVGFYRPCLKTDQGMAGNFLPFRIDGTIATTNLTRCGIQREEGLAFPEPWYFADNDLDTRQMDERFIGLNLHGTAEALAKFPEPKRIATKGRTPFFFIRPALPTREIIFGRDIVDRVTGAVENTLEAIRIDAETFEQVQTGRVTPSNLIYCQPDVYVQADGTVTVERINCPDVGLFLGEFRHSLSTILPGIQHIVRGVGEKVYDAIAHLGSRVTIVTRDEVLERHEDLLEIHEITAFRRGLEERGVTVEVCSVSQVGQIPTGENALLLNIDYSSSSVENIFRRHAEGNVAFFPNPYFQAVSQRMTGMREVEIPERWRDGFLQVARSNPTGPDGLKQTLDRLGKFLSKSGLVGDILHATVGGETIPIFRQSMHAWRQLASRVQRSGGTIRLRALPVSQQNLLLTSSTGPRLHVFRFTFVHS